MIEKIRFMKQKKTTQKADVISGYQDTILIVSSRHRNDNITMDVHSVELPTNLRIATSKLLYCEKEM